MTHTKTPTRGAAAIADAFRTAKGEGRCALVAYLTLGYPNLEATPALVAAIEAGGADIIELGVPFSDPLADGPTIQAASYAALEAGATPGVCLALTARLRREGVTAPLILMGYYNPILSHGEDAYARDAAAAGADGLIVPDLPPEEGVALQAACAAHGLALIYLVAPNSSEERIAAIADASEGFVYVVSRLGTTGEGQGPGEALAAQVEVVRRHAHTPVAAGFGISRPEQAREVARIVDGAIVGSAIVARAPEGPEAVREFVASLRAAM